MRDFPAQLIGQELKERYPFTCPGCGRELDAAPSLFMRMGANQGGGHHKECGASFTLWIDDSGEKMTAELLQAVPTSQWDGPPSQANHPDGPPPRRSGGGHD